MTGKKSFLITLRIVFVLFSIQFLKDAFYKWDGYSYYMRFTDFLPDLSLAFILWTIMGVVCAFVVWLIAIGLFKIIPKSKIAIRFEHIIAFFVFIVLIVFVKRTVFSFISLRELTGLSRFTILIIGVVLAVVIFWYIHKYIKKFIDRFVYELDSRITPLAWLFVFLFILSVPFSVLKKSTSDTKYIPNNNAHVTFSEEKRPNIILVTMDALTARDMHIYGYDRPTTPFISEWAKDAVVFNKAYASSNWTTPAAMSLMTGQRPWTHKVWYQAIYHPVSNYENNLPRVLKDYGYAVYGFVQNHYAHPEILGIKDAFLVNDKYYTFEISKGWWFDKLAKSKPFKNRPIIYQWIFDLSPIALKINSFRPPIYTTLVPPEVVYNRFLEYISQTQPRNSESIPRYRDPEVSGQRPFFAWLHLLPPHEPYLPPKPYAGLFGDAGKFNTDEKQYGNFGFPSEYTPERQIDVDILRKRYDEFILYSDKQFELFISRLAETIDMSNTIVIFTSDHGESFSHGFQAHGGPPLYEPLVHIPLIIKMPGKMKGKKINMPVEQTDIAPTILELAGIPVPSWMEGRSLLPLLVIPKDRDRFREGKTFETRPMFSMFLIKNRLFGHPITKGTIAVWHGDYKLIYYLEEKKKLLFNLKSDPGETQNIFNEKPDIAKKLISLIDESLARANEKIIQKDSS